MAACTELGIRESSSSGFNSTVGLWWSTYLKTGSGPGVRLVVEVSPGSGAFAFRDFIEVGSGSHLTEGLRSGAGSVLALGIALIHLGAASELFSFRGFVGAIPQIHSRRFGTDYGARVEGNRLPPVLYRATPPIL